MADKTNTIGQDLCEWMDGQLTEEESHIVEHISMEQVFELLKPYVNDRIETGKLCIKCGYENDKYSG